MYFVMSTQSLSSPNIHRHHGIMKCKRAIKLKAVFPAVQWMPLKSHYLSIVDVLWRLQCPAVRVFVSGEVRHDGGTQTITPWGGKY